MSPESDSDDASSLEEFPLLESGSSVNKDDFVIVKFMTKTSAVYYIDRVLGKSEGTFEVKFLRRRINSNTFIFPQTDDIAVIERDDMTVLPRAQTTGTARTAELIFL